MTVTFSNLIDDGILAMLDANASMFAVADPDVIGEPYYEVDLLQETIAFGPETAEPIVARANWIGSCDSSTWLWGWENINNFPPGVVAAATNIKTFGEQYGVPELTTAELPHFDDGQVGTAWKMAIVASLISGRLPTYFVRPSGTTVGVILVDHPRLRWSDVSVARIATIITQAASTGYVTDWRRALGQYAAFRGLAFDDTVGGLVLRTADGESVTVTLDDLGRVANVTATNQPNLQEPGGHHA